MSVAFAQSVWFGETSIAFCHFFCRVLYLSIGRVPHSFVKL